MKLHYFTALVRGFFTHLHHAPRVNGLLGGALILAGMNGALGTTLLSAQSAFASPGACTTTSSYGLPSTVSLASAANGVTIQDDGVSTYGIGGTTVLAVRSALNSCAPSFNGSSRGKEFLAYTSYAVNWQYDIQSVDSTTCRLSDIKVGLHVSQLLPALTTLTENTPATQAKWASFMSGLQTHENGHKTIDITQANDLFTQLTNLRASCAAISSDAQVITNASLANFLSANADHDTVTDYGRDQGATW